MKTVFGLRFITHKRIWVYKLNPLWIRVQYHLSPSVFTYRRPSSLTSRKRFSVVCSSSVTYQLTPLFTKAETKANAHVIHVPPPSVATTIIKAMEDELDLVVCITEGIS
ncbi:hypothetical protein Dsin_021635 [Dipteronia sinensis]|uniref:CoA-binding domain-containing protein n=1 Tax=Dipteronia sinensis TaxID=43782 RepID=A0AAE0DYZ6_9ROSI|nr:hypothetical protein Dsin_021635 [Dipteronia sinensis]